MVTVEHCTPEGTWVQVAQDLEVGQVRYIASPGHTKSAKPVRVYRQGNRIGYYCCACGSKKSKRHDVPLNEYISNLLKLTQSARHTAATMPAGLSADDFDQWPTASRMWFYKAGLDRADAIFLGAVYSPREERVYLPVKSQTGAQVFWQARDVSGRPGRPKYISANTGNKNALPVYPSPNVFRLRVVICEDILSAYKVGKCTNALGFALLGTRLSASAYRFLADAASSITIWLDADAAGDAAVHKILPELQTIGVPVKVVRAPEPKLLPQDAIQRELRRVTK
jgi:hypothetical protein